MATLEQKIAAERAARAMVEASDLAQPDWVEYGFACIRLFWEESKVVLIVDIDDPDEDSEEAPDQLAQIGFGLAQLTDAVSAAPLEAGEVRAEWEEDE